MVVVDLNQRDMMWDTAHSAKGTVTFRRKEGTNHQILAPKKTYVLSTRETGFE